MVSLRITRSITYQGPDNGHKGDSDISSTHGSAHAFGMIPLLHNAVGGVEELFTLARLPFVRCCRIMKGRARTHGRRSERMTRWAICCASRRLRSTSIVSTSA
eukprot:1028676-Prorocentrum_minimum.AAC.2